MNSTATENLSGKLVVRSARIADLDGIEEMISDFAVGHPAATHQRSRARLQEAYFGQSPVAHLVIAARGSHPGV